MSIRIQPERFLADLATLRSIGACGTGVVRPALSPADIEARRWLKARMTDAGLQARFDPVGNLFGIAAGSGPSLLIGSHSDTQPEGGWLDGAYGVICGLEIARAAKEAGRDDVSVVSFCDEEGRFEPLLGSRFWTGELSATEIGAAKDSAGTGLGQTIASYPELRGAGPVPLQCFRGFLEPHIEQGPVLDRSGEAAGVVTAIAGMRHVEIVVTGQQNHAGTTPMPLRRDALQGFLRYVAALNAGLRDIASDVAVWTVGKLDLHPNAVSIVPGRARAVLQMRDATGVGLDRMAALALELAGRLDRAGPERFEARLLSSLAPTELDLNLQALLADAADELAPQRWRRMISGALHDAGVVGRSLPAAMLFAPSIGGISHSFDEDTRPEHLVLGCAIAAGAVTRLQR